MNIKIYTTTTCPFCRMEKEYLDSKSIKYENVYVDEDPKAAEQLMSMSGQFGVPFTVFTEDNGESQAVLGFDKERINQILKIS